jgi:hypothetical protein
VPNRVNNLLGPVLGIAAGHLLHGSQAAFAGANSFRRLWLADHGLFGTYFLDAASRSLGTSIFWIMQLPPAAFNPLQNLAALSADAKGPTRVR